MAWIDVKDRLPTLEEYNNSIGWFLVWINGCNRAYIERYDEHDKLLCNGHAHVWETHFGRDITHWQELPPRPTKEAK